jgi:[glutamine synthetase] adenylyltransferase / [glutamine synthetase]-adenylyl-L-tyrosine phosphorylase
MAGTAAGDGALIDRLGAEERWPQDPRGGASLDPLVEDWRKNPAAESLLQTLENSRIRSFLAGIVAGSSYLRSEFARHPARLDDALRADPHRRFAELTASLAADLDATDALPAAMTALRTYKSAVAQLIALCDLAGIWDVVEVTRTLSATADAALQGAVRFLFRQAVAKGEWLADPAGADLASGYIVLAVGKYGACELHRSHRLFRARESPPQGRCRAADVLRSPHARSCAPDR